MKDIDKNRLLQAQQALETKKLELYLARGKHRSMKRTFRGIMSYPQRKILFEIGKKHE